MDGAQFQAQIAYFGESNLLAVLYDNSAVKMIGNNEFTMARNYIDALESLVFVEMDNRGNPFHVVKHVENIQGLVFKNGGIDASQYDRVSIRG